MRICPKCGARHGDLARVCPADGTALIGLGGAVAEAAAALADGEVGDETDPGADETTVDFEEPSEADYVADQATLVRDSRAADSPRADSRPADAPQPDTHFLDMPTPVVSYHDVAAGAIHGEETADQAPAAKWITVPPPVTDPDGLPVSALIEPATAPTAPERTGLPALGSVTDPPTERVPTMSEEELAAAEEEFARQADSDVLEIESASAPRPRPTAADKRAPQLVIESQSPVRPAAADSQLLTAVPHDKRRFGRYLLLCRFAAGGMADVLLATIPGAAGFEKLVAIKRVHEHLSENRDFTQMFLDEARIAAQISHPNVVQVIELGRYAGTYFLAMEYVAGPSLRSLAKRTRLPHPMAARIVSQVAAGLHAAHELCDERGEPLCVVHRDVSPGNVLISSEGAVKIADFGVARARSNLHTTAAGTVKGKFAYMAPEQATARAIDRRTDIFALGVVLFEITTNHRLFKAHSDADTIAKVLEGPIPSPSRVAPGYPPALEEIVLRALQRDPGQRYQTALEMHVALEEFVHTSTGAVLPSSIGSLVRRVFAAEIAEREELIQRCKSEIAETLEESDDLFDSPSYSLAGTASAGAARARRRRSRNLALAMVGVGAAALATVLALLFLRSSPSSDPTAAAQRKVQISVEATPANASVHIDGRKVSNPGQWTTDRSDRSVQVVVSAPGYRTRRVPVPLSSDAQLMLALEPQAATPRPVADARPPKRTRRRPAADAGPRATRIPTPDAGPRATPTPAPPPQRPPKRPPRRPPRRPQPKKGMEKLFSNPYDQ